MLSLKDLSFELCNRGCLAIDPTCDPNSKCLPECPPSEVKARIRALGSLCLTSRLHNTAFTQHLFHRPDTDKWWLLARTLLRRPHLAAHVKRLSFPELYLDKYPNSGNAASDVWSYYSARLGVARDAALLRGDPDRYGEYTDVRNPDDNGYCRPTFEDTANERAALLATLCPRLETFKYRAMGGKWATVNVEQFHPLQGRDLLFELEKNLQKVVVDFSSCSNWLDTNDNGEWGEWSATERKDMTLVQSFREKGIESEIKI